MTHRERGPSFLRAALSVLHENANNDDDDIFLIPDPGDAWGRYIYIDPAERPLDENQWYELLTQSTKNSEDLVHFWQQFCLNWPIVTGDLQRLSKAIGMLDDLEEGTNPLTLFHKEYLILFECL